ncbi:AMIN-like domain-containing (lipo)protein [Blastococcus deserti]|uniref:AMIN-like domain-containing protein n=1 Tax=Blastococcus deserti TaxID=2259033 RepID=A0ABW4X4J0_9ACTN
MSTRSRAAAAVLSLLLAGPLLLAGCGEGDTSEAASSSSASADASEAIATTTPAAQDSAEDGTDDAPDFPADTEPDAAEASADAAVTVSDIRIGTHDGFDRVVLEVGGTGTPGWDVRYVDAASSQGSGEPVAVTGAAVLQVTLTGAGYPYATGVEEYAGPPLTGTGTSAVTEVVHDATFEGTSVTFVGTAARNPFRVYALENPTRVVVEVAHAG